MSKMDTNKLQIKDLVTIGIFSAIYFAINLVVMISGGIAPIVWIFMPATIALLSGVVFMLMTSKVQKFGPIIIMSIITSIIYLATGQFTLVLLVTFGICSVIAEFIRKGFGYKSFTGNLLAYAIFSLGMTGSPLPIWLFGDTFLDSIMKQGMSEGYVEGLKTCTSTGMLIAMFVATFIAALIGGFIGKFMLKKHFKKAGIV